MIRSEQGNHRAKRPAFPHDNFGLAAAIALALIAFVFVTDFPGPSPAGGDTAKSEAPPEDVTR